MSGRHRWRHLAPFVETNGLLALPATEHSSHCFDDARESTVALVSFEPRTLPGRRSALTGLLVSAKGQVMVSHEQGSLSASCGICRGASERARRWCM